VCVCVCVCVKHSVCVIEFYIDHLLQKKDIKHYTVAKTHRMPYKLQVIFRKRDTNYRALLQKMTYIDKASYDSTSCVHSVREV